MSEPTWEALNEQNLRDIVKAINKIGDNQKTITIKCNIIRTLTPKPYNAVKMELGAIEVLNIEKEVSPEFMEQRYNQLYGIIKKKLNQIEQYETERIKE